MRISSATLILLALSSGCVIDGNLGLTSPIITTSADTTVTFTRSVGASVTISIQNGNGPIDVGDSPDGLVHVTAYEQLNGSPLVRIQSEQTAETLMFCSIYDGATRCADGIRSNGSHVVVQYIVLVPPNQRLELVTGNGAITVTTDGAPPMNATTGNGDITAMLRGTTGKEVALTTGNGSIRLTLPGDYNGIVDAITGNGTVRSDLPLSVEIPFDGHRLRGTLGRGGSLVRLTTGNGALELKKS